MQTGAHAANRTSVALAYCLAFQKVNTKMAVSTSKGPTQYTADAGPT